MAQFHCYAVAPVKLLLAGRLRDIKPHHDSTEATVNHAGYTIQQNLATLASCDFQILKRTTNMWQDEIKKA